MDKVLTQTPELAPDYYLTNFRFMLDWVWERYADLLNDDERTFIQAFHQVEHDAQCLLVRLSSRKGVLFRRDKLSYAEIPSLDTAAQQLIDANLMSINTPISVEALASSLTKPELLVLFSESLTGLKQARKELLVQTLAAQLNASGDILCTWQEWTNNQFGAAWHLDNQTIISNFLLLFFGNAYQDLTEFVLQDLGLFRYENYPIDHQHRIFKHRTELEQYRQLIQLREQLELDNSAQSVINIAAQLPDQCATEKLQRRRAKLCNQLAYELERAGEHALALQLYEQSHLPPARERRIRLLEKQNNLADAWSLLNQLIAAPQNEHELQIAQRMAPRLAKKTGLTFDKKNPAELCTQLLTLPKVLDDQGNALRVEEVVRLSLHTETTPCVYAENALLGGIFGLWLWPEMFRGIEGAFANPFQAAPLDLYQENFATNRPAISALWAELDSDQYRHSIRQTWTEKRNIANHFVNWNFLTSELLDIALHAIPASHLKLIFTRLLFDIKNNRSGLPDLIQFYPQQNTYRMIEVKGPGDRIQDNQQRWLEYFAQHAIPAEVCYVRWQ